MEKHKHLGSYLRQKRMEVGYSQVEIGKILGYQSSQFVSNWERGLSAPPEKDLPKIIKLFKLDRGTVAHTMVLDYAEFVHRKLKVKKAA